MIENVLVDIIEKYPRAWEDLRVIKAILADYYPEDKLTRNLLLACVEERIPHDIFSQNTCSRYELQRYANKVVNAYGCPIEKAREVVYLWAEGIGIENLPPRRSLYPGHEKCETLRAIRIKIAEANSIDFVPVECTHEGPCQGTCPVCDAEIRYIDRELQRRKAQGDEINIDGIADSDIKNSKIEIPKDGIYVSNRAVCEGSMPIPDGVDDEELPFN